MKKQTNNAVPPVPLARLVRQREVYSYRCPACGEIYKRKSTKRWIKSYCEKKGRVTRLQLVQPIDEITRAVRALKRQGVWPNAPTLARAGKDTAITDPLPSARCQQ